MRKDILYVLLLICISGNPLFSSLSFYKTLLSLIAGAMFFILLSRRSNMSSFINLSLPLLAVLIIQAIDLGALNLMSYIGFFVRLFIGYAIVTRVRRFPKVYCELMYRIAIMSWGFWAFGLCGGGAVLAPVGRLLGIYFVSGSKFSIGFHTYFLGEYWFKNSGVFWEPGAFGSYLIIALLLLVMVNDRAVKFSTKRYFFVYLITIFTTFSTTAYVIVPIVLIYYMFSLNFGSKFQQNLVVAIGGVIVLCAAVYSYDKIDFLQSKIERQLETSINQEGEWYSSRFGSILFDWEYISQKPLTGWGFHESTRYALHPKMQKGHNTAMGNGFSDFLAKIGFLGVFTFFVMMFKSAYYQFLGDKTLATIFLVIIFFLLQGEHMLNYPLYWGLCFIYKCQSKQSDIECLSGV